MGNASRFATTALGIYAGLLGMVHGGFAAAQGNSTPDGIMIYAVGGTCQPEAVYHACLPAMTLIPNFLVTGLLALAAGLALVIWSTAFVRRRRGALILGLLALLLLLVGGGFIPFFTGVAAAVAGSGTNSSVARWRRRVPNGIRRLLAGLWPRVILAYFSWVFIQAVLGNLFNDLLLKYGTFFLLFEFLLLLLTVLAALASDSRERIDAD